jgi:sulfur-carrier protein
MESVQVQFAAHLQRHVACPPQHVPAGTLEQVLAQSFLAAPAMRGYVLNDQGHIRKHVAVFIDQKILHQREQMDLPIRPGSKIVVIQALSGG